MDRLRRRSVDVDLTRNASIALTLGVAVALLFAACGEAAPERASTEAALTVPVNHRTAVVAGGSTSTSSPGQKPSSGPVSRRGQFAAQMTLIPKTVRAGQELAVKMRNPGRVTLGYGFGLKIERLLPGRCDPSRKPAEFAEVCDRGKRWQRLWSRALHPRYRSFRLPLLLAAPGQSTGPDVTAGRDAVVTNPTLPPGQYRAKRQVSWEGGAPGHRPGIDQSGQRRPMYVTASFRVVAGQREEGAGPASSRSPGVSRNGPLAGRAVLAKSEARPGETMAVRLENHGSVRFFELGQASLRRWTGHGWGPPGPNSGPDMVGSDIGNTVGPGRSGPAVSKLRLPEDLPAGRYLYSRRVFADEFGANRRPQSLNITATLRVRPGDSSPISSNTAVAHPRQARPGLGPVKSRGPLSARLILNSGYLFAGSPVAFIVQNRGRESLAFGEFAELWHRSRQGWREVKQWQPGARMRLPYDIWPGRYRFVMPVASSRAPSPTDALRLSVEFRVLPTPG